MTKIQIQFDSNPGYQLETDSLRDDVVTIMRFYISYGGYPKRTSGMPLDITPLLTRTSSKLD